MGHHLKGEWRSFPVIPDSGLKTANSTNIDQTQPYVVMEIFIRDYVINLLQNKKISENTGKFRKWQMKLEK